MQRDLLSFVLIKLLVFAPFFNAPKMHVLHNFVLELAAFLVARRNVLVTYVDVTSDDRRIGISPERPIHFECN